MVLGARGESYWQELARSYATLGPPLRPSTGDLRIMEDAAAGWVALHPDRRARMLLLGVTPDIALAPWPGISSLLAIDRSLEMVRGVWPANRPTGRQAVCGDWLSMPCREASFQIAIGDGAVICVRYPEGIRTLARSVRRALSAGGILILRCYVQPEVPESPEAVFADMYRTAIPTFHHFKLRLLMALQPSAGQGVRVDDVYRYWASRNVEVDSLAARTGWNRTAIDMIELYRGKDTVHFFPNMTELRSVLLEQFEEVSVCSPPQYMGDCCPTLVLKRP